MVETRLTLEPEVQEILKAIDQKRNFLLSGGAGSGKTYSLVQVIRQVISENPTCRVACMTYTNAAVKEIEERVSHLNLKVSTIHDFIWDNIKHFQTELKKALIHLANDEAITTIKIDNVTPVPENYFDGIEGGIQYTEYLRISEGKISHDELLLVAKYLFEKYPKLTDIIKDKFSFIFIDEYQDTNKAVIESFLSSFRKSKKANIVGFFGDAMQAIYDDGIGNLDDYKGDSEDKVFEIKKEQNRRNPQKIIDLANKIRTDGIHQVPSSDLKAPNMSEGKVKEGNILFIALNGVGIESGKELLSDKYGWDFSDSKKTKELNLTHNLIADKAGFRTLMDIYDRDLVLGYKDRIRKHIKEKGIAADFASRSFGEVIETLKQGKTGRDLSAVSPTAGMQTFIDNNPELFAKAIKYNYETLSKVHVNKDQLLDDKKQNEDDVNKKGSRRDNLIRHLYKIQTNISLYKNGQYNEFLRVTDYREKIKSIKEKKLLKENIESLINVGDKTIEEIISQANEKGICMIDDKLLSFQKEKEYLYDRVKQVKFSEFQFLFEYLEGKTPFSTQHKTKGTEFDNVLVILDNGGWNLYNFERLFLGDGTQTVLERTQKIFYVCCTRSKENLAVIYDSPNANVVEKAKLWFGDQNVISLS
jgi:DNA helicase-2/ATP-dependent DNA helicase PcrA